MLQRNWNVCAVRMSFALLAMVCFAGCAGVSLNIGPLSLADSAPRTGTLLYADPGVVVTRHGHGVIYYEPGMEVVTGDSIETADGQAVIDYKDGSVVVLNRATRVRLGSISLFFGEIFARIKSIATRGGGQVLTDELSASVEGTEYGVRRELPSGSNAPGNVSVFVREGHVLCAPGGRAKWSPVRLTENQSLAVAGYRAPAGVRPVDAGALSRWADQAEQRLRQARTPPMQPGLAPFDMNPLTPIDPYPQVPANPKPRAPNDRIRG